MTHVRPHTIAIGAAFAAIIAWASSPLSGAPKAGQPSPFFPIAVAARTTALEFHAATPAFGSIETQLQAQLKELSTTHGRWRFVKLRIFAVGSEAQRVAERAARRWLLDASHARGHGPPALPAISVVGVAAFADSGQRLQVEATVERDTVVDPNGIAFFAGVAAPTAERAAAGLARVARQARVDTTDVRLVSCFAEDARQARAARRAIAATFPNAETTVLQSRVVTDQPLIECEAIGRLAARATPDVQYVNLLALPPSPNYAHATLVSTPELVFASGQLALGADEASMVALFDRLRAALMGHHATLRDVVMGDNYWLTDAARDRMREVRSRYFMGTVPAATGVFFASLASPEAVGSLELVVAAGRQPVDTLVLAPGSPAIDGRFMVAHDADVSETVTKSGVALSVRRFVMHKRVVTRDGRPTFQLVLSPSERTSDQRDAAPDTRDVLDTLGAEALIDLRTMGLVRREEHDRDGLRSLVEAEGAHVRGVARGASAAVRDTFEFTLPQPAFHASFIDAAMNAVDLKAGLVLRVPAFGVMSNRGTIVWHQFRVVARDTVRVLDHVVNAWVLEESAHDAIPARRIWVSREPPYFPLDITYLPDGTVRRTEQRLATAARERDRVSAAVRAPRTVPAGLATTHSSGRSPHARGRPSHRA